MNRTLIIGDIHGGLKALKQITERAKIIPTDTLIFLGDYVDGWPESAQVVAWLKRFAQSFQSVFIKGNHDVWCDLWLQGNKADSIWLKHGGRETIASYAEIPDDHRYEHLEFFAGLRNYMIDEAGRLFIHAGYSTIAGPGAEFIDGKYSWDRTLWETALRLELPGKVAVSEYPPKYLLFKEIYIGHTPTIFYNIPTPVRALNLWNIDTGAGFDGKLTAFDITTGQYWQSDPVPDLYPGVTGRAR